MSILFSSAQKRIDRPEIAHLCAHTLSQCRSKRLRCQHQHHLSTRQLNHQHRWAFYEMICDSRRKTGETYQCAIRLSICLHPANIAVACSHRTIYIFQFNYGSGICICLMFERALCVCLCVRASECTSTLYVMPLMLLLLARVWQLATLNDSFVIFLFHSSSLAWSFCFSRWRIPAQCNWPHRIYDEVNWFFFLRIDCCFDKSRNFRNIFELFSSISCNFEPGWTNDI